MSQTTTLVGVEFLSWIRDRLKEEAERREPKAEKKKTRNVAARMRTATLTGLTLVATMFSAIL